MTGAAASFGLAQPCPVMNGPHCGLPDAEPGTGIRSQEFTWLEEEAILLSTPGEAG